MMANVVKIDGSIGEGGGQVLRIALSLSAVCGIPVEIDNIRSGRPKPGLAAQHLKGVELARDLCNGTIKGAHIGSTRLAFYPGSIKTNKKREYYADIRTAGCICLLAQTAVPITLFLPSGGSPITLILKGGTNVPMGPQVEYFTEVFRPWLNKFGGDADMNVIRRGYYPKGGGEVHLRITPVKSIKPIEVINRGNIRGITGWVYVAGSIHLNEAYQIADRFKGDLRKELERNKIQVPPINIEAYKEDRSMAVDDGFGINIVCDTDTECILGGSGLGSTRGRAKSSDPAHEALQQIINPLINESCVDEHMQDQIIILMAIANGRSRVAIGKQKLTQHTETAIKIAEIMLKDRGGFAFNIKNSNSDSEDLIMECDGCGILNN